MTIMDVIIHDSQINASTETLYNDRRASNTINVYMIIIKLD